MITAAGVQRLRSRRADEPAVLSVYLGVPVDVGDHRGLPTRARELIKSAASHEQRGQGSQVSNADVESIINAIDQNSAEWLGHTVAFFACSRIGLIETVQLPRSGTEQAVIADRPHIRPLLAALQRHPDYRAAVVDTKHAWVLHISDDRIETVAERTGTGVRSPGFGGWYGLEAYRVQQRIMDAVQAALPRHDQHPGTPGRQIRMAARARRAGQRDHPVPGIAAAHGPAERRGQFHSRPANRDARAGSRTCPPGHRELDRAQRGQARRRHSRSAARRRSVHGSGQMPGS